MVLIEEEGSDDSGDEGGMSKAGAMVQYLTKQVSTFMHTRV